MTFPAMTFTVSVSKKAPLVAACALAGLFATACGNTNLESCYAYVDAANAALVECNRDAIYDPAENCPETLAEGPDVSQTYQCLAAAYTCDPVTQTVVVDTTGCVN